MKKMIKIAGILAATAMMFFGAGCSGDEEDDPVALTGISLETFKSQNTKDGGIILNVKEYTVVPDFTPSNASNKKFTLSVTDGSGNEVDGNSFFINGAKITPKAEGTFVLKVTSSENSDLTDSVTLTVEVSEESVILNIEENATGFASTTGSIKTDDTQWFWLC